MTTNGDFYQSGSLIMLLFINRWWGFYEQGTCYWLVIADRKTIQLKIDKFAILS